MLFDEYRSGRSVEVWRQLRQLGAGVRDPHTSADALAVARETMARVRDNVVRILPRLGECGYALADPAGAHVPPTARDVEMIAEIEAKIGPLPLSFRAFHEVVGSVNLCQSLEQLVQWHEPNRDAAGEVEILGEEDPLFVRPVSHLYDDLFAEPPSTAGRRRRGHYARYNWRPGGETRWYYCFAPDEFHKANYSGGENYNLFVPDPRADFRIRDLIPGDAPDEPGDPADEGAQDPGDDGGREWFVDYLRHVFAGGGFRGRSDADDEAFRKRVPASPLIDRLRAGLLDV